MVEQTLRPSGDYSKSISYPQGVAHYSIVNDQSTTQIAMDSAYWLTDLYTLPNPTRIGAITNVRVYVKCQARPAADHSQRGKTAISIGGTTYYGSENYLQGSTWKTYHTDYAQNPNTSANWTWDDIDNLLAGVALIGYSQSYSYAECAEVWVVVTSFPSSGGGQFIGLEL